MKSYYLVRYRSQYLGKTSLYDKGVLTVLGTPLPYHHHQDIMVYRNDILVFPKISYPANYSWYLLI